MNKKKRKKIAPILIVESVPVAKHANKKAVKRIISQTPVPTNPKEILKRFPSSNPFNAKMLVTINPV